MMKSFSFSVLVLLLVAGSTACSLFGGKPESAAKIREPLEVPPDLARPQSSDLATGVPSGTAVYST
jgi:hypothetical protein